jgi:hypothetical protein
MHDLDRLQFKRGLRYVSISTDPTSPFVEEIRRITLLTHTARTRKFGVFIQIVLLRKMGRRKNEVIYKCINV